jgi:hypothetical protein
MSPYSTQSFSSKLRIVYLSIATVTLRSLYFCAFKYTMFLEPKVSSFEIMYHRSFVGAILLMIYQQFAFSMGVDKGSVESR